MSVSEAIEAVFEPLPPPPPDPYEGQPVIAGVDSGSAHTGLTIGQGQQTPIKFLHFETFDMETVEPLKKPRTISYSNGQSQTITTKQVWTVDHARAVATSIMERLAQFKVTHLVLEYVDSMHLDNEAKAGASAIGTQLIRTAVLWSTLIERATAAGITVILTRAATWRAALLRQGVSKRGGEGVGRKGGKAGDVDLLRAAISTAFANWPKGVLHGRYLIGDGNNHERDAGGLVVYGVLQLQPKARPAAAKSSSTSKALSKPKKRRSSFETAAFEKARNERKAVGCTCGRKHKYSCPLSKFYKQSHNQPTG